jgi:ADP-ribose pyrophosphatase YjhB (NUDIX family)
MSHQLKKHASQGRDKSANTADAALKIALSMLPLHAEEGGRREVLSESELMKVLIEQDTPEETSKALIWTLRRQFEALALLDPMELRDGKWAFVSFPASLLGRSWLTTLATPGQVLLSAGYWGQDAPEGDKEEQRTLLHRIETGRVRLNPQAHPIRVVHVAWAWIRIGDKFLMHRREDKARPGEKSFGLPGGRFNLDDLPFTIQSRTDILKEIYSLDSGIVAEYIKATLERELKEETDLTPGTHYTYENFGKPLPPYMGVNGPGNRHAYSAYKFHLFHVKLTHAGETHLLAQISKKSSLLKWFTAAEIVAPQRTDGASAYVDALHQAWGKDLEKYLSILPDSSSSPLVFVGESMMLDLPGTLETSFQLGKSGKEKAVLPAKALEDAEWQLLMLLGWHARGLQIQMDAEAEVRLLGNGWIEAPGIIPLAHSLHKKIQPVVRDLVEIREDRFISLRISPDILFFSAGLFRYQILGSNKAGGKLQLKRLDLITPWGNLNGDIYERDINGNTVATLRELEKGDEPIGDWERTLREQFGEGVRGIGLRRLWSTKGNVPCLVEGLRRVSETSPDA